MEAMPPLPAFVERYDAGAPQVVFTRLVADLETPVSAYLKLAADKPMSFLLESVEGGAARGRYSVIGLEPDLVWRADGDPGEAGHDGPRWLDLVAVEPQDEPGVDEGGNARGGDAQRQPDAVGNRGNDNDRHHDDREHADHRQKATEQSDPESRAWHGHHPAPAENQRIMHIGKVCGGVIFTVRRYGDRPANGDSCGG